MLNIYTFKIQKECKAAGKQLMVWTVNEPHYMMEAVRWEVDAILTDTTKTWLDMRQALNGIPRRHRKRFSAICLSSDTTTTLPEYTARAQQQLEAILPSDRPPDYPDSAEEGTQIRARRLQSAESYSQQYFSLRATALLLSVSTFLASQTALPSTRLRPQAKVPQS
ncbi:PLC phosphodiesterase [Salix suchowensis]|nr:PLC phosphodiesterase [Salix suchowensis]